MSFFSTLSSPRDRLGAAGDGALNEVCSSTASLKVSTTIRDSMSSESSDQFDDAPEDSRMIEGQEEVADQAPSSFSIMMEAPRIHSREQQEGKKEESPKQEPATQMKQDQNEPDQIPSSFNTVPNTATSNGLNPLNALAMACAAEKDRRRCNKKTKLNHHHNSQSSPMAFEAGMTIHSVDISSNDVLCGRGGLTNHHPGNVFFRRVVRIKQEAYLMASKREKAGVAREIVQMIRDLDPPGRFLKKDAQNPGVWIEIGDRKAREKTSQALREGAPELREELQTTNTTSSTSTTTASVVTATITERRKSTTTASPSLQQQQQQQQQQQALLQQQQQQQEHRRRSSSHSPPPFFVQQHMVHDRHLHHPHPHHPYHHLQQQHQRWPLEQTLHHHHHHHSNGGPRTLDTNSSRVRVVSADSGIMGLRPLFHSIAEETTTQEPNGPAHVIVDDLHVRYGGHHPQHHYRNDGNNTNNNHADLIMSSSSCHSHSSNKEESSSPSAGVKRKSMDLVTSCSDHMPQRHASSASPPPPPRSSSLSSLSPLSQKSNRRGPRLKLFKSRLQQTTTTTWSA